MEDSNNKIKHALGAFVAAGMAFGSASAQTAGTPTQMPPGETAQLSAADIVMIDGNVVDYGDLLAVDTSRPQKPMTKYGPPRDFVKKYGPPRPPQNITVKYGVPVRPTIDLDGHSSRFYRIADQVADIVEDIAGIKLKRGEHIADLRMTYGLSKGQMKAIAQIIEAEFDLPEIPAERLQELRSVDDFATFVDNLLQRRR